MTAQAVAAPFRTTESLMAASGILLAAVGGTVLGLVVASDSEHGAGNWNFAWLAPLLSLLFLTPAAVGVAIIPARAWTGGALIMANTAALLIGAAAATSVVLPLGLVYLPAVVLLWRAGSRAIARRGSEEIVPGRRPYLIWAAGGITPILAFLLIASRLYQTCTVFSAGRVDCRSQSLGAEGLVLALIAAAVVALVALAALLLSDRGLPGKPLSGRWAAALPAAAAVIGLVGLASPLAVIGLLALALVLISLLLFFLPTETKMDTQGRS